MHPLSALLRWQTVNFASGNESASRNTDESWNIFNFYNVNVQENEESETWSRYRVEIELLVVIITHVDIFHSGNLAPTFMLGSFNRPIEACLHYFQHIEINLLLLPDA